MDTEKTVPAGGRVRGRGVATRVRRRSPSEPRRVRGGSSSEPRRRDASPRALVVGAAASPRVRGVATRRRELSPRRFDGSRGAAAIPRRSSWGPHRDESDGASTIPTAHQRVRSCDRAAACDAPRPATSPTQQERRADRRPSMRRPGAPPLERSKRSTSPTREPCRAGPPRGAATACAAPWACSGGAAAPETRRSRRPRRPRRRRVAKLGVGASRALTTVALFYAGVAYCSLQTANGSRCTG